MEAEAGSSINPEGSVHVLTSEAVLQVTEKALGPWGLQVAARRNVPLQKEHIHTYVYMCIHIHTHTYVHIKYTYIYMNMYIYMYDVMSFFSNIGR